MSINSEMTALADQVRRLSGETAALGISAMTGALSGVTAGAGNAVQIGQDTPSPSFANLFYALEHGTAKTGTFTLASALSGETLILSSGLDTISGIMLINVDRTDYAGTNVEGVWIGIALIDSGAVSFGFVLNTTSIQTCAVGSFLVRGSWRIDGGDLYVTPHFNASQQYTPFRPGETYRWVAW